MANIWLVPVVWDGGKAVLGKERLKLEPADRRERFLTSLQSVHPRLLLLFKATVLLDDEAAEACGVDELPFTLGLDEDIRLTAGSEYTKAQDGEDWAWPLSHCAEAYLNRLLAPSEAAELLTNAKVEPEALSWLNAMQDWLREGRQVILLREDERP